MGNKNLSSDLLRGHTDTIVLGILRNGNSYGYAITKEIIDRSNGLYELNEATLYSSFKRLEQNEYVLSYWGDETRGGRRKYYQITLKGQELYDQNKKNWEFTKKVIDMLLRS